MTNRFTHLFKARNKEHLKEEKTKVKKGEVIGYVGHATVDHISFNIDLGKGYLTNPESKIHGLLWENYPKNPNALLLPIILEWKEYD